INEADIATELNIGRTPINQAMHRLALEDLIVIMPRKGIFVKPLSYDELEHIIDCRTINECHAARRAAIHGDQADLARMREVLSTAAAFLKAGSVEGFLEADKAFHTALSQASGNDVLAGLLETLHDRAQRYWFVSLNSAEHMPRVQAEHEAIFAAIEAGDPESAERAMAAHIASLQSNLTGRF
ncbi:MAG: GntR family transcriptional regulator, partial [Pseudomonadota bacterium]